MKLQILVFIFLFISVGIFAQDKNVQKFYVGTFTSEGGEGIYFCDLNSETGEISLNKTFKGVDNPSFLKISKNKKYLYSVSRATPEIEKSGGFVVAYEIGKNGNLQFINKQISNGTAPCHVDVAPKGDFVAIAAYGSGTTSLYPVQTNGALNPASCIIVNKIPEDNKQQKIVSHAHSIKFSHINNTVYSADLGTDQLNIYQLENKTLKSASQDFVKLPAGAGPRHFEFSSNENTIYVINELNSTISTLKKEKNSWEVVQNISTLPEDFSGESFCADVHISNDGKFLYGSNRGHNSIAVFKVDTKSEKLTFLGTVPVEGNWPRNFGITPDGNWMLVANQKSGNITVFRINKETGRIIFNTTEIEIPAAVCIEFL